MKLIRTKITCLIECPRCKKQMKFVEQIYNDNTAKGEIQTKEELNEMYLITLKDDLNKQLKAEREGWQKRWDKRIHTHCMDLKCARQGARDNRDEEIKKIINKEYEILMDIDTWISTKEHMLREYHKLLIKKFKKELEL